MSEPIQRAEMPPRLHVVIEPRAGHTIKDLLEALEQTGATAVDQISAEFVSAEISPGSIPSLERYAFIEIKKPLGLA